MNPMLVGGSQIGLLTEGAESSCGNSGTTTANILTLTGTGASCCTVKVYDDGKLFGATTSVRR